LSLDRKTKRARAQEREQLQNEVYHLQCALDELYSQFDRITDSAQVDACIYQLNAVISKYDYTIKCLKAFEMT